MYTKMPDSLMIPAVNTRNANYFEFREKLFRQDGGKSIGKKHAPDSSCLGAGKFEEEKIRHGKCPFFTRAGFSNIFLLPQCA